MSNILEGHYLYSTGKYKVYSISTADKNISVYVDPSDNIQDVTLDAVFRLIKSEPGVLREKFSADKCTEAINGHHFYFPTVGGGLFSKGHKLIKPVQQ